VVKIENTGTLDAYVRVKLEPKWEGTQEDAKAYYMVKNKVYKIIGIPSDHVIPQGGSEIVCPVSGLLKWICGLFGCDHKPKDPPKPNDPAKWFYNHDDDYYYYTKVLEAGKGDDSITKSLIDKVCFEGSLGNEFQGAIFDLKVEAEAVQASREAVKDVWGLDKLPWEQKH
jgi:hypothetical protein